MIGMIYYCEMGECLTEVIWRKDDLPICFYPEPFRRCSFGNVCNEPDNNFVLIFGIELRLILDDKLSPGVEGNQPTED